jgi:hypothetical protein
MKKAIIFFFALTLVVGCKKKEQKTMALEEPCACIPISQMPVMNEDPVQQQAIADWLLKNGDNVCEKDELERKTLNAHTISEERYTELFHLYRSTGDIKDAKCYTVKTWREISDLINVINSNFNYCSYVSFDINPSSDKVILKLIPKFDPTISCYSIALFRAIAKNVINNDDAATFEFTKAETGGAKVIFTVKDKTGSVLQYYNISEDPRYTIKAI